MLGVAFPRRSYHLKYYFKVFPFWSSPPSLSCLSICNFLRCAQQYPFHLSAAFIRPRGHSPCLKP
jgi:hypothetical protein